ncbi:aminotransferase class I/II-fold pyridoxal phosphate-dependent enzyme [Rubrobacter marinus]|uniref:Aminotransferase n=1 Tax=Rubrobacter marinus TaxID=2653852 RepID=A0A6G8PXX8_9ACTN|nr:aminotransferase class I/II-fold pyridoxal phosphate-dependent enzyme [Rubrobacter marinus]QIN79094.1 aminotransferase class I/II-fold pyridoxal phosphate-dependent enzyme [Rubrobacter marinus]
MVSGYASTGDGRHHGAHGADAARALGGEPPGGFLDFSANINPLGPPEAALYAAQKALVGEVAAYPDGRYPELCDALAGYLEVRGETVLPTNGGAEALFLAARAAAGDRPGGRAVVLDPTFSEYAAAARAAGLVPESRVARRREDGFRLDPSVLDDLGGVSVVFLCNPNNPTGDLTPRGEVLALLKRARSAGAALVVDEAFADFAPGESVAGLVDDHLYVARSFTKFFAVPGLRLGCLVARDPERVRPFQPSWSVNVVAAAAGVAAAGDSGYAQRTLSEVALRRGELCSALDALPGLEVYAGSANFLLLRGPEGLPERLARRGVLVRGCGPFPGLGPRFCRIAVRGAGENARLVSAVEAALEEAS